MKAETAELVLMTYQMANNDRDKLGLLLQQHKCLLVLDESHHIKRFEGGTWAPALIDIGVYARIGENYSYRQHLHPTPCRICGHR